MPSPQTSVRVADPKPITSLLVIGSLVTADLLLLAQATLWISRKSGTVTFAEWALVFLTIAFGAWLASLAVMLGSRSATEPAAQGPAANLER